MSKISVKSSCRIYENIFSLSGGAATNLQLKQEKNQESSKRGRDDLRKQEFREILAQKLKSA